MKMNTKNLQKISKCTKSYSHVDDRNQHVLLELINIGMYLISFAYIIMKAKEHSMIINHNTYQNILHLE